MNRKTLVKYSLAFLMASAALSAAPMISITLTCDVPTSATTRQVVTGTDNCSLRNNYRTPGNTGFGDIPSAAQAAAMVSYSSLSNGFLFTPSNLLAGATANSHASADVTFSNTYYAEGPLRPGFVQAVYVMDTFGINAGPGAASAFVSIPGWNPYTPHGYGAGLIPVSLGQAYTVDAHFFVQNMNTDMTQSSAQIFAGLDFRFFEADGVTPAAISDAPEPASLALMGMGIGILTMLRKTRVSSQRQ